MKVVINKCFGGFGLSAHAQAAFLARKGKPVFFYAEDRSGGSGLGRDLVRIPMQEAEGSYISHTSTKNWGPRVSREAFWADKDFYFYARDMDRADPALVAVVDELGPKASGPYAKLVVVEIPDGTSYFIDEYDGMESIHEEHRSWS